MQEIEQNLAAPMRIWDWNLAPEVLKRKAVTQDDVDWVIWVPEHMEHTTADIVDMLSPCDYFATFYREADAQAFLGPEHRGDGFIITCHHS